MIHASKIKTSIAIFGPLCHKGDSGLGYFNYQFVKYFEDRGALHKVYCLTLKDSRVNIEIPSSKLSVLTDNLFFKAMYYGLKLVKKAVPGFSDRYYTEVIFDFWLKHIISFDEEDILLCLKPVTPQLIRKAKSKNVMVVTLADIAHPEFIYSEMKKIEARYGIKDKSSYTLLKRIKRLTRAFNDSDIVIPRASSQFINKTYLEKGVRHIYRLQSETGVNMNLYSLRRNFNKHTESVNFVSVAQFSYKKGLPLLLEVWNELVSEGSFLGHLHIIGSLDTSTKKVVKKHFQHIPQVTFHDYTVKVHEIYPQYDVFIASSISDSGPRTVIEAMACGLPAIVSNHCGTADLVEDGLNGFTYDPFDLARLKSLITWFVNHKDKIQIMGKQANQKAKSLSYDNFLEEMYFAILDKYKERQTDISTYKTA